jgi:HEAT repeat protein
MSHPQSDESLPELLRGLKSSNAVIRTKSARALAKLGPTGRELFQALYTATEDSEQAVREAAVQGIGSYGEQGLPVLIRLLGHKCKYVRRNVVWAIGKLGTDAAPAVRALCNALKDTDPRTAGGAAQALGAIGRDAADAVAALAETMRGTNVVLCRLASKSLSQIGLPALPTLVAHLDHHDPFVRGEAAVALGWMGVAAAPAVPALITLLSRHSAIPSQSTYPKQYAGSGAVTPLAVATPAPASTDDAPLIQVIQAFGRIGPSAAAAESYLLDFLTDHRESVRLAAADAIQAIRDE